MRKFLLSAVWLLALSVPAVGQEKKAAIRALLVTGGCCHDYEKQKKLLSEGVSARADVEWVIVHEGDPKTTHRHSIFEKADWARGFDVVVHDQCTADVKDLAFIERILKPHREGLPAVVLHCGMHSYRSEGFPKSTPWFEFTGLATTGHGPQAPIAITYVDREHAITQGLADWSTGNEELYNNSAGKLQETAKALARGKQTYKAGSGREKSDDFVVAWTNAYAGKTRVFATTLGHNNATVGDARYLDLITRGLLWAVDKLDEKHLKPAKAPAAEASPAKAAVAKSEAAKADVKKIAASLKAPAGFDLAVFAAPPDLAYPTAVAASPGGELFVAVDENGSVGREADRKAGIIRCVDRDNDGVADQFTMFAAMEHPRGIIWDDGVLYVLHPPFLSAYYDDNRDGVADRSEVLVRGVTSVATQKSRGADHTTNGIRLGIDGWIYIAVGDFGMHRAAGRDGAELTYHTGGVVRVRPDGSGLEAVSYGQRNIYDVAVDPYLNLFTRDNTNDGDGWDVRLSHVVPTAQFGYPRLFKNFSDEIVKPLAEYGGGSPCGALFVDEPGLPEGIGRALYTVEWGRNAIYRHPLTPDGASFKAGQEKFMDLPRGTDIDVDAAGRFYLSSWNNGGFSYSGPNVGYVVRLSPSGKRAAPAPDLRRASDRQLLEHLSSTSGVIRLAAQREMLRREGGKALLAELERAAAADGNLPARAAAVFTIGQIKEGASTESLRRLAAQDALREFVLRALADRKELSAADLFAAALTDENPRVRLTAAWGLGRVRAPAQAQALLARAVDADPLVAHVAINSLVALGNVDACLESLNSSDQTIAAAALKVLQRSHDAQVVDKLIERLGRTQEPERKLPIYTALARLCFREADWNGDWWGTRPDTSGPYFRSAAWAETARIKDVLKVALTGESEPIVRRLVVECQRHKIDLPELPALANQIATRDPAFRDVLVNVLTARSQLGAGEIEMIRPLAISEQTPANLRARAVRVLMRNVQHPGALDGAVEALASVTVAETPDAALAGLLEEFVRDDRHAGQVMSFVKLAGSRSPGIREVGYGVLANISSMKRVSPEGRAQAEIAIERAWKEPAAAASLLRAIGRTKAEKYKARVETALSHPDREVALAAEHAAHRLGIARGQLSIETIGHEETLAILREEKGDANAGAELFVRRSCGACHTIAVGEAPKGPFLGDIGARYSRMELAESILKPSAKIAQGFETQWFRTTEREELDGFVTRESGDEVELRNAAGTTAVVKKSEIKKRGKRNTSVMPDGLVASLTPKELANLLAYLESLRTK